MAYKSQRSRVPERVHEALQLMEAAKVSLCMEQDLWNDAQDICDYLRLFETKVTNSDHKV